MDNIPFDESPGNIRSYTQFEGKDATVEAQDVRVRPFNLAQINAITVDVSDTARVVNMAGVEDEFEYQIWRRLLELGRRMEFAAHWAQGRESSASSNQTTVDGSRVTHGLIRWLIQTGLSAVKGTVPTTDTLFTNGPTIPEDYYSVWWDRVNEGGSASLSRAILFNNILAPAWRNGFNVGGSFVFSGARLKQLATEFSAFADGPLNTRNVPAEAKILYDTIDVIDTNLGSVYWNLDRYLDINARVS